MAIMDTAPNQQFKSSEQLYIATDGSLKSCFTAPLMELPVDFREWPKWDTSKVVLLHSKAA
jgi:hypothetical protein